MRKCKPALQCMAICHTWTDPIRLRPFGKEVKKKEDKEDKEDPRELAPVRVKAVGPSSLQRRPEIFDKNISQNK